MYLRMFVILGVTLYTARVVIRTLGIDDYGLYNIVGGIVVLFSFVNISLRSAIQRFISFELGGGNIEKSHKVIASGFVIITIFSLVLLLLAETIGLWFVQNKVVIPADRMIAALWVYQFSIFTFIISMYQSAYQATIISHEKMSFYAGYSIVEALLKLLIAFILVMASSDKLILYAGLGFCVSVLSFIITAVYSHRNLSIPFRLIGYKEQFTSLFSYSTWSMVNSSTVIIAQQGGNIILNMFVGVIANGAFGIANQVSAAINGFVSNFQSAFNPQITKLYAAKEFESLFKLINRTSLFSFCLLLVIAIPFFLECDYILCLWLGETPQYASGFCNLMLVYFLIDATQAPLWMLIFATGKVRTYQIWSGLVTLLNIPIAWYLLSLEYSAYCVFFVRVSLNGIIAMIRPFYVHSLVSQFSLCRFFKESLFPIMRITVIGLVVVALGVISKTILHPFLIIIASIVMTIFMIWFIGIDKQDKKILRNLILEKIKR